VLIDTERAHIIEPVVGGDQRVAVVDHALMSDLPANTEHSAHLSHRVEVFADPSANLPAGPLRQRRPHADLSGRL